MAERTIGNYVLGPLLGRGGMSEVHAAEHRFLGDRVAIKRLRSHLAADPAASAAFVAEAARTRAIEHANVVRVLDVGSDGDAFYLVMERLDGESLAARLARSGPLDEAAARRLGAAVADGVAAAHDRGIVHRDLTPGNIMLVGDQPVVIDFGIARELAGAAVTGSRVGTIAYMAPEQLTCGLIAPCVDIWALGAVLYEALAGRLPFDGFADGRSPQLFETPPRLASLAAVSPTLEALITRCLERDPSKRPASMRALAEALRSADAGSVAGDAIGEPRITEPLHPAAGRDAEPADRAKPDVVAAAAPANRPMPDVVEPAAPAMRGVVVRRRTQWLASAAVALAATAAAALWLRTPDRSNRVGVLSAAATQPSAAAAQPNAATVQPNAAAVQPTAAGSQPNAAQPTVGTVQSHAAAVQPAVAAIQPNAATAAATPPNFTVEVRSAPPGAKVLLAGKQVGITPATIALAAPAAIIVTRAGYRPSRVRAEHAGAIDIRLTPAPPPARPVHPHRAAAGETLD